MLSNFTAKYKKISSGYMGQIVEWPEVITEGKTLEECREMLEDALKEMMLAYFQLKKEIPQGRFLFEPITVEVPAAAEI
ncbi:MAG: type II toxin-antitoxin system HicB family antitoxin [Candidatus Aminicenantes bacterium]|nr:type II toxin-antitoxin system HicB family antitoxin [Candidatus Aminicenantes bacterium]